MTRWVSCLVVLLLAAMTVAWGGKTIKFQSQHINVVTRSDQVEIGDEPGHAISLFEAKGLGIRREGPKEPPYKIEIWGTGDSRGDGTGKGSGYGKFIWVRLF